MDEREVWRAAGLLVRRHGSRAPEKAEKRADGDFDRDDAEGWAAWTRIAKAAVALLKRRPDRGERVN